MQASMSRHPHPIESITINLHHISAIDPQNHRTSALLAGLMVSHCQLPLMRRYTVRPGLFAAKLGTFLAET